MGIRFFCPNGHRLNVKSFLAGKRGVCPDCGVRVDIPTESDASAVSKRKASKAVKAANSPSGNGHHSATAVLDGPAATAPDAQQNDFALPPEIAAGPVTTTPPITITTPSFAIETVRPAPQPVAPDKAVPAPVQPAKSDAVPALSPSASRLKKQASKPAARSAVPPATTPPASDPIAEAPMAIWYVRPVAGGQYGPARGDVMSKWLSEGRVTADSLVWREGWPDWRSASKVFPHLGPGTGAKVEGVPVLPDVSRRPIRPHRKPSTASGIGIVVALGVVCVGLFAALIYVLISSSGGAASP